MCAGYKNRHSGDIGDQAGSPVRGLIGYFFFPHFTIAMGRAAGMREARGWSLDSNHPTLPLSHPPQWRDIVMSREGNVKPVRVDPRWCVLGDTSIARTNKLTPDSIQEALRMFLQPIKNEDPRLDFYTMYKRETVEYDTEYMRNRNEDLNATLIFVRFRVPSYRCTALTIFTGWSILRGQLRLRHRRPVEAPAGFQ